MNILSRTPIGLISLIGKEFPIKDNFINDEFNPEEMKNIHGESVKINNRENLLGNIELGFAIVVPEYMNGYDEKSQYQVDFDDTFVGYLYVPDYVKEDYLRMSKIDDEDEFNKINKKVENSYIPLFSIFRVNLDEKKTLASQDRHIETFKNIEKIATNDKDEIFIAYNKNIEDSNLEEDEKKKLSEFVDKAIDLAKSGLMLFPPQDFIKYYGVAEESVELDGVLESFLTTDLYGEDFDPKDFTKYDLNIVNVWSSGCGPCIAEMPDLQKLNENLPDNVSLTTICIDGDLNNKQAKRIMESVKATFRTLKGDKLKNGVLKNITGTPTTLFLDSHGNQVGDAIVAQIAGKKNFVEDSLKLIHERLDMLE